MINVNLNPQTLYKAPAKNSSKLYSKANTPVAFQGKKEDNETDKNTINLTPRQRKAALAMLLTLSTMISPACSTDESNNKPIVEETYPETSVSTPTPAPKELTFEELKELNEKFRECTENAFMTKLYQGGQFTNQDVDAEMKTRCPDTIKGMNKLDPETGEALFNSADKYRIEIYNREQEKARQREREASAPPREDYAERYPSENPNSGGEGRILTPLEMRQLAAKAESEAFLKNLNKLNYPGTVPFNNPNLLSPAEMAALASQTPEGRAMVEQQMRNAEAERIRQDIREHNQRIREEASEQARIARERQMWDDKIRRMKINP